MINKTIHFVPKKEAERVVPMLVQTASRFQSRIHFTKKEKTANVKSIMGMLNFGLNPDEPIDVMVDGEDEEAAMKCIEEFLTSK